MPPRIGGDQVRSRRRGVKLGKCRTRSRLNPLFCRGSSECASGVGEAKAGVAGCALGQRGGEDAGGGVVVVVYFGRGLARVGAQDSSDVLNEVALLGYGRGEEEGVEDR